MEQCNADIYKNGTQIAMLSGGSEVIEGLVREANKRTDKAEIDWHYFAGRAIIKATGDLGEARKALESASPDWDV